MPSLLTIPHEIRDAILESVLLSSRPVPPDVATAAEHRLEPLSREHFRCAAWHYGPSHTRFEQSNYVSNAYPLLLVNQQLSAETKSAVSRLTLAGLSYKLDVMVVQEREVWPTWLCIPSLAEQVDHVDVTFRILGTRRDANDRSVFMPGNGSPPQIYWCFYFLLEHFLTHGPLCLGHGKTSKCTKNREVSVKTVNLNFVAGDTHLLPPTEEDFSYQSWFHQRQEDDTELPKYIMRPEWLAKIITGNFENLLSMGYHTATYGRIIYERMGSVRFSVDGELSWETDIGKRLASLSFGPDAGHTRYTSQTFGHVAGEDRLRVFWRWKEEAVRKRNEGGLPVPDPVVMPSPQHLSRWQ